ncbi:hypothetical protein N2152v2_005802 [Parachlorella kessleri]
MAGDRGPVPRLMIREMVLENFKSYAGEQRCFSSVVGPNGSGKSNVIDAMLFVFGKRAKQLRLNKVSELIHNSTHHRNLEMAKVSVHFQEIIDLDDEGYEVVPNSSFVISRTAHRSNKSDYYINERRSNFTEVTELLKGKGIDLDNNRFLILQAREAALHDTENGGRQPCSGIEGWQRSSALVPLGGEVEQISMMKPKAQTEHETGLLEYLEDIIGTDKYIPKLEETSKRLEELNEKRQGMVQRVKIAEKERDGLEAEKTNAEAYLTKQRECLAAHSMVAQVNVSCCKRNVDKIESNIRELEEKLAHEKEKFKHFDSVLKEREGKFNTVSKEYTAIQKQLEKANEEFKEFERKDIKFREDLKFLKQKIKKLDDKLAKDTAKAGDMEREVTALQQEVPQLQARAEELAGTLKKAEEVLEGLLEGIKDEVEGYRQQLRKVRSELAPWEKQITEVQSRIDVAAAERDLLSGKHEEAQERLATAQEALQTANETAASKRGEIKQMEAAFQKSQAERARQAETAAQAEVSRLEGALREVRGRVEQRRGDLSSQQTQGAVVKALLQARDRGEIEGIYGRLGDLGAIDAQYDVAASTACPSLDYIVVDTTSAAQRCVELLRQRQLGVATFLILEKQRHLEPACQGKASPPEGVPRLFDLVKCRDERLRVAFYYAMRDTIVARDLEQASRIAYGQDKRWRRVVTLKGEMINESGTMSGGGGKPRGGRMCVGQAAPKNVDARAAAAELQAAEQDLEGSVQALQVARQQLSGAAAEAKQAEKALAELETAIPKARMEADSALARAEDLKQRMGELQQGAQVSSEDAARIKALGKEIQAEEGSLKELRRKSDGLTQRVAALEQQIEGAGGEKLRKQRALVAKLQEEIGSCESDATKRGVQAANTQKQLEKLRKELDKGEKEKTKLAAQQETTMKEFKGLEDAALKVLEAVRDTQQLLADKEEELNAIRAEFEQKQKEVGIIRQAEVEFDNLLDQQRAKLKGQAADLRQWKKEAEKRAKEIEELDGEPPAPIPPDQLEQMGEKEEQELQASPLTERYTITMLDGEMQRMNINLDAIELYRRKDADYGERVKELEAATSERDTVRREHEEVRKRRLDEFMAGFNTISMKLKEMYQMITMGGDAELELVDSLDPFSEGILFGVRPPKKSWKNIANLSGGEKTLSSLSLVFALHHYKPTPLYVMDEIDAALDFKNVSIVGHYIKERTKNAQFVIISLRNNMFELADRLVGIYKTDNTTKSVAINPGEFTVGAAAKCAQQGPTGSSDQEQIPPAVAAS